MRYKTPGSLAACGLLFILLGLAFSLGGEGYTRSFAQDLEEAEYVGARECGACHRGIGRAHAESAHGLALQNTGRDKDLILGDFEQGEAVRQVVFPGEDEPRAFTADDIAFAVGSGRYTQRYLFELGRDEYLVLPAQWNTVEGEWQPYRPADEWPDAAYEWGPNCAGCHTTGLNTRRFRWEDDGVQCEACHGPGSIHVEVADDAGDNPSNRELRAIRAAIVNTADPQACGQCHSRGHEPDDNLPYPADYLPGSPLLDDDVYVLVAADDPASWWPTDHARLPNMQFNEWLESGHAEALETLRGVGAAEDACLVCHSGDYRRAEALIALHEAGDREGNPPEALTLESAQFGVTCTTCHSLHGQTDQPALLVDEPDALCAACHSENPAAPEIHHPAWEMVTGETLIAGIEGVPGAHAMADDGPTCATCHVPEVPVESGVRRSHALAVVAPAQTAEGQFSTCATCHSDLTPTDLQYLIDDTQSAVLARLTRINALLTAVDETVLQNDGATGFQRAGGALTFVRNDGSLGFHNYAYASALLDDARRTLTDLSRSTAQRQPTEAPAPTAIPAAPLTPANADIVPVASGIRPATLLVIALVALILTLAAVVFFRSPDTEEASHE